MPCISDDCTKHSGLKTTVTLLTLATGVLIGCVIGLYDKISDLSDKVIRLDTIQSIQGGKVNANQHN
jgi:uncharacterized membrane protein YqgA involved in biofilm formation